MAIEKGSFLSGRSSFRLSIFHFVCVCHLYLVSIVGLWEDERNEDDDDDDKERDREWRDYISRFLLSFASIDIEYQALFIESRDFASQARIVCDDHERNEKHEISLS